ncbi:MAG: hypothetical protein WCF12_09785 [Propionicimonas sp.]
MDPLFALVGLVVVGAAAAAWWFLRRRRPSAVEEEWTLPPADAVRRPSRDVGPQILDRQAVLRRDRVLDPSKWDNTPDDGDGWETPEADPGDLPQFFDRDYLQQRAPKDDPNA